MRQRCSNPNHAKFQHYGGRGIRVCDRWSAYENFVADMGMKPTGLTLDRINVDGNYEPTNCRWATQRQQLWNMRVTRKVVIAGITYVAAELAQRSGLKTDTIVERSKTCKTLDEVIDAKRRVFTPGLYLGGIANGKRMKLRTHCLRGHVFSEDNTSISPQGWRRCKACHREKMRRRYKSTRI